MGAHIGRPGFRLFHRVLADGGMCVSTCVPNCKGDDDIDEKRSRPSIGKPGKTYAQKERVNLIGNDQRITSGPAVKRPCSKAEYMTAPERLYPGVPRAAGKIGITFTSRLPHFEQTSRL